MKPQGKKTVHRMIRVRFCVKGLSRYDFCVCLWVCWMLKSFQLRQWMFQFVFFYLLLKYLNLHFDTYLYRFFLLSKFIHSFHSFQFACHCILLPNFYFCFCFSFFLLCLFFFMNFRNQFEKTKKKNCAQILLYCFALTKKNI